MDPVTVGLLATVAAGAGSEAGKQLWEGLMGIVRRPFRGSAADGEAPELPAGAGDLELLRQAPADPDRARALSAALDERAAQDPEFRRALNEWAAVAAPRLDALTKTTGGVHNSVSGGRINGPVVQGGDFSHLTFNMAASAERNPE